MVVTITGHNSTVTYNGSEQSVNGYDVSIAPEGVSYTTADFSFNGNAEAKGTDAGEYKMGLTAKNFENTNTNFTNVTFVVTDGYVKINPRSVTLTSTDDEKVYDGTPLTNDTVTVSGDGFAKDEGATYDVTGSQTDVGESKNTFTYKLNDNTKEKNYEITKTEGTLKVTANETEVVVTITGHNSTVTYNGSEQSVNGYDVSIAPEGVSYTTADFSFNGNAEAKGTDAGEYKMGLTAKNFENTNTNFTNVTFVVTDGYVKINPRSVTLTSTDDEKVYDGTPLTNDTVTVSGDGFAKDEGATYDVTGSQTDVGESKNTFTYKLNDNTKEKNYEITKTEGTLKVTAATAEVVVTIKENAGTTKYDGTEKTVTGYTVTNISNKLYTEKDFTFNGTAEVKGTDAGTYDMALKPEDFANRNANFSKVKFVIEDGQLVIEKRKVTLTSGSGEKVYDGTALTNGTVTVGGADGFADGEGATYDVTGSQTVVGESDNTFTYTLNKGTKADNYTIEKAEGKLKVTPVTAEVVVTITEHSGTATYDGKEHTVTGYDVTQISNPLYKGTDFTFSGNDSVSGINAGTYDMELKPADFENTSKNFTNVKFEIVDGKLEIKKRSVTLTSATDSKVYDGNALTNDKVAVGGDGFVAGEVTDIKATGSVKDVSEGEVTNAITFTKGEKFNEDNYAIEKKEGTLTITPRPVTLTSAPASKVYDGNALTNDTVTAVGFVEGEGATYDVTGSQTNAGSSKNMFTYAWNEGTNKDNYTIYQIEGDLVVTPIDGIKVTITGRKDTQTYDGKPHKVEGYDVKPDNPLFTEKDIEFNGEAEATGTDVRIDPYQMGLKPEQFTNTSNNFTNVEFVVEDGQIVITPRPVTLTSETASKTYDGTPLTRPNVTVSTGENEGFVEGEVTDIKATGSVTNAGSVANTITFTPNKETFKEGNYAITKTEGTLTIAKRSVLITSPSATKTYDGSALTRPAVTITGDGFVPGELAKAEATGSITNVGSTPNAIRYTTTGAFNAANYSIALSVGTLTVTEKPKPEPRRTFNLTINYVYQNGKRAAASYNRGGLKNGETFDITSPVIAGYTASETVVSGTIYNRDIKVTVIYTADGVNLDDYGVPLGLGNITMNVGDCFE